MDEDRRLKYQDKLLWIQNRIDLIQIWCLRYGTDN